MKNIVVIGGNAGVGLEVVKACLTKGYRVAVAFKESEISFPIPQNENLFLCSFDLQNTGECIRFIEKVVKMWKRIDGVVFYAGITPISSLTNCTVNLYDQIFDINLKSSFFITQTVINNMIANQGGTFVFFGTSHMESGHIDRAAYAISKGGLKTLSNHIAKQYSKNKVRSNIIVMGWTPTEGELSLRASLGVSKDELIAEAAKYIPMGRMLNVTDPIPAVMYFLSDDSAMVTGSTIRVNGGEYI
jgi:NAD(P)-dependent dehydrogenase (short-subunit alcohol dehydrogenase family)